MEAVGESVQQKLQEKIAELQLEKGKGATPKRLDEDKAIEKATQKELRQLDGRLNGIADPVERAKYLRQQHAAMLPKLKRAERLSTKRERIVDETTRELDITKKLLEKTARAKVHLEELCRGLQQQSKEMKELNQRSSQLEQEKRAQLSSKFEAALDEINKKMELDAKDKQQRLQWDEETKQKLQVFSDQFETQEKHFKKILETKNLELQLSQAKLNQQEAIAAAEAARAKNAEDKCLLLAQAEQMARDKVEVYMKQLENYNDTVTQTHELINSFKAEQAKKTKYIKKLETENRTLQSRCKTLSAKAILMVQDQSALQQKADKLAKLCRALQQRAAPGPEPEAGGEAGA